MDPANIKVKRLVRYGVWLPAPLWLVVMGVFIPVVESGPRLSGEQGMARGFDIIVIFVLLAIVGLVAFAVVLASSIRVLFLSRREPIGHLNFLSAVSGVVLATAFVAAFFGVLGGNLF